MVLLNEDHQHTGKSFFQRLLRLLEYSSTRVPFHHQQQKALRPTSPQSQRCKKQLELRTTSLDSAQPRSAESNEAHDSIGFCIAILNIAIQQRSKLVII